MENLKNSEPSLLKCGEEIVDVSPLASVISSGTLEGLVDALRNIHYCYSTAAYEWPELKEIDGDLGFNLSYLKQLADAFDKSLRMSLAPGSQVTAQ